MIKIQYNNAKFNKEMNNVVQYSIGFLDGAKNGKAQMMNSLANSVQKMLNMYIDAAAKASPELLHHVYEWNRVGGPRSRLFDIRFSVSKNTINFFSEFRQSTSIKKGSKIPFADKALIMEQGIKVTIVPKKSPVLVFETDGEEVFTRNPVTVENPGGQTAGQYKKIFDQFFNQYFAQTFLSMSGVRDQMGNLREFSLSFPQSNKTGRSAGLSAGYKWMTSIKIGVE